MRISRYFLALSLVLLACGGDDGTPTDEQSPSAGGGGTAGSGGAGAGGSNAGSGGGGSDAGFGGSDAGVGGSDAGSAGKAGEGGAGQGGSDVGGAGQGGAGQGGSGGGEGLAVERWGGRLRGLDLAVRRSGRLLWIGSRALPDPYDGKLRGGLTRLDLDTGDVRTYEAELPEGTYDEGKGPMGTAEAVEDGDRTLVVAREGILVREGGSFTLHKIGTNAVPYTLALDRGGDRKRLWVGTNLGVFRLHADTLEQEKFYEAGSLGGEAVKLAVDPSSGAAFAVMYGDQGSVAARIEEDKIDQFSPGKDGVDAGILGDIVFSQKLGTALFALRSWDATTGGVVRWNGSKVERLVTEGQLAKASTDSYGAFGAASLALDDESGLLLVGGQISSGGPGSGLKGGGLAWVELASGKLAGLSMGRDGLPGDHVASMAYDPVSKRVYATLRQPCNELKLGNKSLVAISFRDGKTPRFERPILSGIRSFARLGDRVLVGLRDDAPGLSCDGYPIQTGLYELHSNHSAELIRLGSETGEVLIPPDAGPTTMAVNGDRLAIGSFRDGGLIGPPEAGFFFNPTQFGPSLYMLDVAWQGDSVWIAGRATHDPSDPPALADVGPYGAARLFLSGNKVTNHLHYARAAKNPGPIVGLPSSEVTAVIPREDGSALLICAAERSSQLALDRATRELFLVDGQARKGGVASVTDKEISVLTQPGDAPDPRAAALDSDGSLLLLDAEKGALRLADGKVSAFALPAQPPDGAVPVSLWSGAQGLVATYDRGAVVQLAGQSKVLQGVGYVWRAFERGSGVLLLGSDEGLLRVRSSEDLPESAAKAAVLPTFQTIAPVDSGGQCLKQGESCQGNPDGCCPGLTCGGGGFVMSCQ